MLPSGFARPDVLVDQSPVPAASIRCPALGAGLLREPHRPTPDGLAAALGATRALPAALAEPLPPRRWRPVSRHLGALRGAGPVSTRRSGRTALHLRTARAADLLPG
ncbi:hypothetical protein [Streptomyces goshikiensis]|uniref:hypothetical protein n=1 Tax=Streptomyces goshikiensis TaxID=1942 RepID=UPI003694EA0D